MVESVKEVSDSVKVEIKNPKSVWWNDDVKAAVRRKKESNAKGKVESCSRIKDGNERLAQGKHEAQRTWKEYFKDMYNIDTKEQVAVHMCSFNGI